MKLLGYNLQPYSGENFLHGQSTDPDPFEFEFKTKGLATTRT